MGQSVQAKTKEIALLEDEFKSNEEALKSKENKQMKMEYELDKNKEIIEQLQQLLNAKGDEIAVLQDDLKNKGEVLKDNEGQTVELMKMKYGMERNEEMIEALKQSLNTKENEVELLHEERNTKEAVLRDKSIELMKI